MGARPWAVAGLSTPGVRCSAEDENSGAGEGREPQSGSYRKVPTLEAGDGEAELLKVTWVKHLVIL